MEDGARRIDIFIYITMIPPVHPRNDAVLERLAHAVDARAATPIYHQIVLVIAWEIRTGRLPIGSRLPPIRAVARRLALNYHTVRRAWDELARSGTISVRQGLGGRVERVPGDNQWTPAGPATDGGGDRVWLVDDSLERAARLAVSIASRWRVEAIPWPIDASAPPPGGILATGDRARARWPGREGDIRIVPLVLDPATAGNIRIRARAMASTRVMIAGADGHGSVAELRRQLPRLGLAVSTSEAAPSGAEVADALLVCLPSLWQRMDWAERTAPGVIPLEFELAAGPLARVAREWGWEMVRE